MMDEIRYYFDSNEIDYLNDKYDWKQMRRYLNLLHECDEFDKTFGKLSVEYLCFHGIIYKQSVRHASRVANLICDALGINIKNELTDEHKEFKLYSFRYYDMELPPVRFYVLNKNKKQYIKILKNLVKNKILRGFKDE